MRLAGTAVQPATCTSGMLAARSVLQRSASGQLEELNSRFYKAFEGGSYQVGRRFALMACQEAAEQMVFLRRRWSSCGARDRTCSVCTPWPTACAAEQTCVC